MWWRLLRCRALRLSCGGRARTGAGILRAVQLARRDQCAVDARLGLAHQRGQVDLDHGRRHARIGAGRQNRVAVGGAGGEGTALECGGDAVRIDPGAFDALRLDGGLLHGLRRGRGHAGAQAGSCDQRKAYFQFHRSVSRDSIRHMAAEPCRSASCNASLADWQARNGMFLHRKRKTAGKCFKNAQKTW